ncbi:MAG: acyl-CoA thioesterase [Syntrophales bacterium]
MGNLLNGYPVVIKTPVAWGEMDAFQHVNNIIYLRYFESARIAYFYKLDMIEAMARTGIGPILASLSCKFKVQITYPDDVLIGAKVTNIGKHSFMMGYCVFSASHQKMAAEGEGLIVTFNYQENRKVAVPEELRQRILALESKSGFTPLL